MSSERAYAIFY